MGRRVSSRRSAAELSYLAASSTARHSPVIPAGPAVLLWKRHSEQPRLLVRLKIVLRVLVRAIGLSGARRHHVTGDLARQVADHAVRLGELKLHSGHSRERRHARICRPLYGQSQSVNDRTASLRTCGLAGGRRPRYGSGVTSGARRVQRAAGGAMDLEQQLNAWMDEHVAELSR